MVAQADGTDAVPWCHAILSVTQVTKHEWSVFVGIELDRIGFFNEDTCPSGHISCLHWVCMEWYVFIILISRVSLIAEYSQWDLCKISLWLLSRHILQYIIFFFNSRHIYILCKNDDQKHSIACCSISIMIWQKNNYRQVSNIKRTLVGDKIVDHSDIVGASPVGVAPTISSFCTEYLASIDWVKANVRWDENHLSFVIWCHLYQRFYGMYISILSFNYFYYPEVPLGWASKTCSESLY